MVFERLLKFRNIKIKKNSFKPRNCKVFSVQDSILSYDFAVPLPCVLRVLFERYRTKHGKVLVRSRTTLEEINKKIRFYTYNHSIHSIK